MNTTNIVKLVACLAWAGFAVSSATPASAIAVTSQSGAYASCSNAYEYNTNGQKLCPAAFTAYSQTIKLLSTACNSGACSGLGTVYTDQVYPTGRKTAALTGDLCDMGTYRMFEFGSCAC
jgi:hypothetical protein